MQTHIAPIQVMDRTQEQPKPAIPEKFSDPLVITEKTTISHLQSFRYHVTFETVVQQVEKMLRASPDLPGVIITDNEKIVGIISRRRFFEILGTRYGIAVFLKRPIHIMLKHVGEPLILSGFSTIQEAVDLALERENTLVYEPILVNCSAKGFQLLDVYTLLLAQSQLFATLQKELQSINIELENRVIRRTNQLTQANTQLNQEIAERKQAEKHLKVRVRYERTVAQAADSLLAAVDKPEVIPETLYQLLKAAKVSRVYLSEYVNIEGEGSCLRLLHQVCAADVSPIPEEFHVLPHQKYQTWIDNLWTGKSLMGQTQSIHGTESDLLEKLGIQSYLLLPVGKPGDWYGMIGLDETAVIRDWSLNDIQLFQTIARMLYTYIERTRSRATLIKAKDKAIKANQFKTELMAKVNHELRTPLGLAEFVAEVDSRTRILAERTGLEFKIIIESEFPEEIIGDKKRIQQIWTNLLSNAIKFTEEGHIHTYIRRHGTEQWAIEVSDTGKGIPKEAQAHIFDAFVQVDGSPTRQRAGTGLGLSISDSIVAMMGGQIHLQSEVDKGTTMIVYLPLQETDKNLVEVNP